MSRNLARIVISMDMLRDVLKLPQNAVIHRVYMPDDTYYHMPHFEAVVEHPDLPAVFEGRTIPLACLTIETDFIEVPKFKSWGIGGR